jgi:hypothetical protein
MLTRRIFTVIGQVCLKGIEDLDMALPLIQHLLRVGADPCQKDTLVRAGDDLNFNALKVRGRGGIILLDIRHMVTVVAA